LDKNAPIDILQAKAQLLNTEVAKLETAKATRDAKKNTIKIGNFDESNYTQTRKDAALWAKTTAKADAKLREVCGNVWQGATQEERNGAYYYTHTYCPINEPLRGLTYIGSSSKLKEAQSHVQHITSIINKSTYNFDMWVQRGVGIDSVKGMFGINIAGMNPNDVRSSLLGKIGKELAFSSCGVSKGKGFAHNPVIYNIYCPKGTKMMYLEPFSQYGRGAQSPNWDGKTKQTRFGNEAEILLQRSTTFRITKVDYNSSEHRYYIDIEVIGQL
jgi:hypothetical protein